jgi:uncharacterized protein (DUF488 family)
VEEKLGYATIVIGSPHRLLYSIGHSTRTYENLVATLRAWNVVTLVDIRHFTRSRANPQFNADILGARLAADHISYVVMSALGGRRGRAKAVDPSRNTGWQVAAFKNYADYAETPAFAEALAKLLELAANSTCAVMCAEAVWWRCHRRIVADYAITRGFRVLHIFTETKVQRAARTPFARVDRRRGTLRYPYVTDAPRGSARARTATRRPR